MLQHKSFIKEFKELSCSGVLCIHLSYRKVRLISSSNMVSSIQRVLPELLGNERVEVICSNISDKKLRSLTCYVHKKRMERLGYKVVSSIKRWRLDSRVENINNAYRWVLRARNTYSSILLGIFDKEEMEEFLKAYYPGGVISGTIISSNEATRRWYEVHPEG